MIKEEVNPVVYTYLASCLTDSAIITNVERLLKRKLDEDEMIEVLAWAGERFNHYYKLSQTN